MFYDLILSSNDDIPDARSGLLIDERRVIACEEGFVSWDLRTRGIELMNATRRSVGACFEAVEHGVGVGGGFHVEDGYGDGQIKTGGYSERRNPYILIYFQIDSILGCNYVPLEAGFSVDARSPATGHAEIGFRFVLKNGPEVLQVYAVGSVEIEVLIAESDKKLVLANRIRPFGQNRSET